MFQAPDLELVSRLPERPQALLDALVVDRALADRQHGVGAEAMEAELEGSARTVDALELAPDPVAPGVLHAQHGGVGREPESGPRPDVLDDLPLELELGLVAGVLPVATAALAEVGAAGLDPIR